MRNSSNIKAFSSHQTIFSTERMVPRNRLTFHILAVGSDHEVFFGGGFSRTIL